MPRHRLPHALFLGAFLAAPLASAAPRLSSIGESARYLCADGRRIEVLYSGGDAAVVTLGERTVELRRVEAAEGERYVGGGVEWWGRGVHDGALTSGGAPTACHAG